MPRATNLRPLRSPRSLRATPAPRAPALAVLLAGVALAGGCRPGADGGPRPSAVVPDRGSLAAPVAVRIRGEDFGTRVTGDFSDPGRSGVDARYVALLGPVALQDVALQADGTLGATVPAGLASGEYDLTVFDPRGRAGTLARAFRVLAPGEVAALVAGYRIEPIGPQESFRPFLASIAAVDTGGAVVTGFNGAARLSDLTGTAVPGAAARFVAGRWSGLVEVRAPHAADVLTVADDQGASGSSAPFAVRPPPATRARFATAPVAAEAGRCAGPVTLVLEDAFGLPAPAAQDLALSLAADPPAGFTAFADPACGTPAAPAIAAGRSAASVWFVAPRAGTLELTATGPGLAAAVQRVTVAAGPPAALAFATPPQAVNAGACSQRATVEVRDAHGNPSPAGALTVAVQVAPAGALTISPDAACAQESASLPIAAGATQASFHFTGRAAQAVTVTASAPGLAPATQEVLVAAQGAASQLAFLTPPRATAAGACSEQVSLQTRDSAGNAVASAGAVQVMLTASPADGFETFSDAACTAAAPTLRIGAGQSTGGFHFRGKLAGSVVVTAASPSLTGATQLERVDPAPPARAAFATAAQRVAAGGCSAPVSLQVRDAFGNAAPVGAPLDVALSAAPAAGFGFFTDPACAAPAPGVTVAAGASGATFHFRGAEAGPVVVTAAPGGGLAGDTQTEELRAAAASRLAFTGAGQSLVAGACSAPVDVEVRDALGNLAPLPGGATISLSASPAPGVAFYRDAACSAPAPAVVVPAGGSGARFHFAAAAPGDVTVTASAPGIDAAAQVQTVRPAPSMQLAFSSAALTVAVEACSGPVTLETRDAAGGRAPVPDATSIALAAAPDTGVALFAGAGCAGPAISAVPLPAGGSSVTFSFRTTAAGPITLTASAPALGAASQTETATPLAPSRLAFATAARAPRRGTCSPEVSVRTEDAHGNPSPPAAATAVSLAASPAPGLTFHADAACSSPIGAVTVPASGGPARFWFVGSLEGVFSISAAAPGLEGASQATTVVGDGPDHLVFTSAAQAVAAGACSAPVSLEAVDAAGVAAAAPGAVAVTLGASPAAGVSFFAGAGCSGSAVSSVSIAAGASAATFSFRATTSGTVTLTAAAAGLAPSPTQAETIAPGALDHFTWAAIPSPQADTLPFPVVVTARDAWGNVADAFEATAALSASAGSVTCSSSCTSAAVTGRFMAGVWTGSVGVSPYGSGLTLRVAAGSATGTSAAFDVSGPAARSPPRARLRASPAVIVSGNDVSFDAGASSDHQTASAQLAVSWDFEATAAGMIAAAAPPAAPWTAWTTAKTATHAFVNNGTSPVVYRPRVAVRDAEAGAGGPDLDFARGTVVVLPNGNGHCTVDTASDVDDGAASCYALGSDGRLSLREALRLANASASPIAIGFGGAMTIALSRPLAVTRPVVLVARPGVALDGGSLSISATGVIIAGLELSRQASPLVVEAGGDATFLDTYVHDGAGLLVKGRARLDGVRMSGCAGACVEVNDAGAYLAVHGSELRGSGSDTGLLLRSCAGVAWNPSILASPDRAYNGSVLVAGTVFAGFGTAVDSACATAVLTNDTFVRNGTGVRGAGAALLDSVFAGHSADAVAATSCPGFATSRRHVVWQNASDGCLASERSATPAPDATFSADPLFVHPASGDYRIRHDSPAKDWGAGTSNVDLDGPAPGRFLGADADRGGRETY